MTSIHYSVWSIKSKLTVNWTRKIWGQVRSQVQRIKPQPRRQWYGNVREFCIRNAPRSNLHVQSNLTSLYTRFISLRSLFFCRNKEEKHRFRTATHNQYDSCSNRTTVSVIQQTVNNSYCVTVICLLSLCSRLSSKRKLESIHGWSNLMRGKNYLFSRNDFKIMASIKSLIASHKKAKYNGWENITRRIEAGRKMTEMQENIKKIFT